MSTSLRARPRRAVVLVPAAGEFLVGLDFSIANIALPSIQRAFDLSAATAQWALTSYAVTFGGLLLVGGRAGDAFGHRRIFLAGLVILGSTSVLAAIAPSAPVVFGARAAQGVGAALVAPAAMALITIGVSDVDRRERALGLLGAMLSIGLVAGVVTSGLLTAVAGWRVALAVSAVLATVVWLIAARTIGPTRACGASSLSLGSAICATGAVALLVLALSQASSAPATRVGFALVASAALMALLALSERRSARPLIPSAALRERRIIGAAGIVGLSGAAATGAIVVLTLYVQDVLQYSAARAGLTFVGLGIGSLAGGLLMPVLIARTALSRAVPAALLVQGLATFVLAVPLLSAGAALLVVAMGVMGFGHVATLVGCAAMATRHMHGLDHGLVSGLLNSALEVGSGLGVAALVAVVATTAEVEAAEVRHALLVAAIAVVAVSAPLLFRGACGRPGRSVSDRVS